MKTFAILLIAIILFLTTIVRADVEFFKEPVDNNQRFAAGTTTQFEVAQLPSFDGKSIYVNLYHDGQPPPGGISNPKENPNYVMVVQSWSPGSVSDNQKNDFKFTWEIPRNLRPGQYYVQVDINNEADDNDFCRSYSFTILPANAYGGNMHTTTPNTMVTGNGGGGDGGGSHSQFVGTGGHPMGTANTFNTRPAGSVGSGMKTSTGGESGRNSYYAGQRYNGGSRYNEGHGTGNTYNAIHLRRALRRA